MTELTQQNSKRDRLKHLLLLRLNWRQITRLIRKFCNEQRTCLKPKSNNDSTVKRINFELKKLSFWSESKYSQMQIHCRNTEKALNVFNTPK